MRSFLQSLGSIIFDESATIKISTRPFKSNRFGIPIYAGARLTPELSHVVLRAKEDNDLLARKFLAQLISDAISLVQEPKINVILIPSRKSVTRFRGIKHINLLVKEVSKLQDIEIYELLEHARKVRDQSSLNAKERMDNMTDAFVVSRSVRNVPTSAYLIDDLITSGATILAAANALQVRNIQLLGAITACATMVFTE